MQLLENIRAVAAIVEEGLTMWVVPPRVDGLTVTLDRGWEERRRAQREDFYRRNPDFAERQRKEAESFRARGLLREPRKLQSYHLQLRDSQSATEWEACLSIDVERRRVDWTYTSSELFDRGHMGSAAFGLVLITLPAAALLSPYLMVRSRLYAAREEREGMSRHGIALLKALGDQITSAERMELREAFKNEWAHDCLMRKTLSFEQAQKFLKGLSLTEERVSAEELEEYGDLETTCLHWRDEKGDCLAQGSFYGTRDHCVQVLASTFEDEEAKVLAACYAKRKLVVHEANEVGVQE